MWFGQSRYSSNAQPQHSPGFCDGTLRNSKVTAQRLFVEGARFRVHTPLISLTKAGIIARGVALGLDYGLAGEAEESLGPLLDAGAFVAGLEFASGVEATVLGKPSSTYFEAALSALDADPELAWMVGDDIEAVSKKKSAQYGGHTIVPVRCEGFRGVSQSLGHRLSEGSST